MEIKSGQATYIAPLQPSTLATFRSWGSSTGAGRIRLARGHKSSKILNHYKYFNVYFCKNEIISSLLPLFVIKATKAKLTIYSFKMLFIKTVYCFH